MAIDNTGFGGTGGGMELEIVTTPLADVTLTKGAFIKTIKADDNGIALFTRLANGTYYVKCVKDGLLVSDDTIILNRDTKYMPIGKQLKDMELGTKVLFGGMKFVLRGLNHEGYPSKSATLMLKYTDDIARTFDDNAICIWRDSGVRKFLNGEWLNRFLPTEQEMVLPTTIKTCENWSFGNPVYETTDKVFLPSAIEMQTTIDTKEGNPLYFKDASDKELQHIPLGVANQWLRTRANESNKVYIVGKNSSMASSLPTITAAIYVAPIINLKDTTILSKEPNSEGYYVVQLPPTKIVDLPLGAKVKMGGYKFKIVDKNHEGYPENSVSLFSDIITNSVFSSTYANYSGSTLYNFLKNNIAPTFNEFEKQIMLKTQFQQRNSSGAYDDFEEYLFPLSATELGLNNHNVEGVKIEYFDSDRKRIATYNGVGKMYWGRSIFNNYNVIGVDANGAQANLAVSQSVDITALLNIKNDITFEQGNDGYYVPKPFDMKLGDLVGNSKIKLSNGQKYILMNKNLDGHTDNSATFVSEVIIERSPMNNAVYKDSTIYNTLLPNYYNGLNEAEKKAILEYTFQNKNLNTNSYYELTSYFYILSSNEVGNQRDDKLGVNVGFTNDTSRIKAINGAHDYWWLRDNARTSTYFLVNSSGQVVGEGMPTGTAGIVPAVDISLDTIVYFDAKDGYFKIKE